jgi:hypothetical protein
MSETATYPYTTHLDIKFDPMTLTDVSSLAWGQVAGAEGFHSPDGNMCGTLQ